VVAPLGRVKTPIHARDFWFMNKETRNGQSAQHKQPPKSRGPVNGEGTVLRNRHLQQKPRRRRTFDMDELLTAADPKTEALIGCDGPSFHEFLEDSEQDDDELEDIGARIQDTADAQLDEEERLLFLEGLSQEDQRGVFCKRWMWDVLRDDGRLSTKGRRAADILAVLIYWTSPGRGHAPNARRGLLKHWTANSSKELADFTGWTEDGVTKSLAILYEKGLVGWAVRKFGGIKRRHYWINWDVIRKTMDALRPEEHTVNPVAD